MDLSILKTYGALREHCAYAGTDDDKRKLDEIERVFEYVPSRENRYIFRLWCIGYSYYQITELIQKDGLYFSYNTVKSKIRRTIERLVQGGIIVMA